MKKMIIALFITALVFSFPVSGNAYYSFKTVEYKPEICAEIKTLHIFDQIAEKIDLIITNMGCIEDISILDLIKPESTYDVDIRVSNDVLMNSIEPFIPQC